MNTFETLTISESSTHSFHFVGESGEKHITVSGKADVNLFFLVYNADIKLVVDIEREHSSVACSAIIVSAGSVVSNIDFAVTLQASHTKADIYALSLLGDNAKAKVNGGIVVSPGIIQAEGYLAEENLLLGKKIQIKALPMLDVRSNDVKASHGSTISRLDDQKIFYLTAKGIPKGQAERLMITSYIQKALDHAKIEENEALISQIFDILYSQN